MCEISILSDALQRYGLTGAKAELIRYNENISYCIDDKYLLRIHKSKTGFSTPMLDFGSIYCIVDEAHCRISIVKGYEEITCHMVNIDEIDLYFALQILLGIGLHYELWANEDWFYKRLPEWCNESFIPLLKKYRI